MYNLSPLTYIDMLMVVMCIQCCVDDRLPQKARHPKHLAQLLSQVVHYEKNKLYMLPKLFQMLFADITDHEDFSKLL